MLHQNKNRIQNKQQYRQKLLSALITTIVAFVLSLGSGIYQIVAKITGFIGQQTLVTACSPNINFKLSISNNMQRIGLVGAFLSAVCLLIGFLVLVVLKRRLSILSDQLEQAQNTNNQPTGEPSSSKPIVTTKPDPQLLIKQQQVQHMGFQKVIALYLMYSVSILGILVQFGLFFDLLMCTVKCNMSVNIPYVIIVIVAGLALLACIICWIILQTIRYTTHSYIQQETIRLINIQQQQEHLDRQNQNATKTGQGIKQSDQNHLKLQQANQKKNQKQQYKYMNNVVVGKKIDKEQSSLNKQKSVSSISNNASRKSFKKPLHTSSQQKHQLPKISKIDNADTANINNADERLYATNKNNTQLSVPNTGKKQIKQPLINKQIEMVNIHPLLASNNQNNKKSLGKNSQVSILYDPAYQNKNKNKHTAEAVVSSAVSPAVSPLSSRERKMRIQSNTIHQPVTCSSFILPTPTQSRVRAITVGSNLVSFSNIPKKMDQQANIQKSSQYQKQQKFQAPHNKDISMPKLASLQHKNSLLETSVKPEQKHKQEALPVFIMSHQQLQNMKKSATNGSKVKYSFVMMPQKQVKQPVIAQESIKAPTQTVVIHRQGNQTILKQNSNQETIVNQQPKLVKKNSIKNYQDNKLSIRNIEQSKELRQSRNRNKEMISEIAIQTQQPIKNYRQSPSSTPIKIQQNGGLKIPKPKKQISKQQKQQRKRLSKLKKQQNRQKQKQKALQQQRNIQQLKNLMVEIRQQIKNKPNSSRSLSRQQRTLINSLQNSRTIYQPKYTQQKYENKLQSIDNPDYISSNFIGSYQKQQSKQEKPVETFKLKNSNIIISKFKNQSVQDQKVERGRSQVTNLQQRGSPENKKKYTAYIKKQNVQHKTKAQMDKVLQQTKGKPFFKSLKGFFTSKKVQNEERDKNNGESKLNKSLSQKQFEEEQRIYYQSNKQQKKAVRQYNHEINSQKPQTYNLHRNIKRDIQRISSNESSKKSNSIYYTNGLAFLTKQQNESIALIDYIRNKYSN